MFGFGAWEIAIIAGVILLVLGPTLLPKLGRRVGDLASSFRQAASQLDRGAEAPPAHQDDVGARLPEGSTPSRDVAR